MTDSNEPNITNRRNDGNGIRLESATLSTLPWATDFLIKDIQTILTNEHYKPFVDSIVQLEADIETSSAEDVDAHRIKTVLARAYPGSRSFPDPPNVNRPLPWILCELVCLYRLTDVLYDLQEQDSLTPFNNPIYPKLRGSEFQPNQFWPLADWVVLLLRARELIGTLKVYDTAARAGSVLSTPPDADTITLRLVKELCSLSRNHDALKILANVVTAALHMASMFRGVAKTDRRLTVPNLPSDPLKWNAKDALTPEEDIFFADFIQTCEIQKIRHALYGALLFSPLYLLTHRKLTSNAWDQERMVMLFKSLGNRKPAMVVKIERLLWESILQIATGKEGCYQAMINFFSKVDWNQITMVSESDRAHFADDKYLASNNMHILSYEGETGLHASWPLAQLRIQNNTPSPAYSAQEEAPEHGADNTPVAEASNVADQQMVDLDAPGGRSDTQGDIALTKDAARNKRVAIEADDAPRSSGRLKNLSQMGRLKSSAKRDLIPLRKKVGTKSRWRSTSSRRGRAIMPFQEVKKGVYIQQVELKTFKKPTITFNMEKRRNRVKGLPVDIFDPYGQSHEWTLEFHFQSDLDNFTKMYNQVISHFVDDKPLYVSKPDLSYIEVIEYAKYNCMTVQEVQNILRDRHILILGCPLEQVIPAKGPVMFNESGVQLLRNLDFPIKFQDQSIPVGQDHSVQICTGTLDQVLKSAHEDGGAIVNALSFPLPLSAINKTAYSSDVEAWLATEGLRYCGEDEQYPTRDIKWGLAATAVCGGKLWLLYTPAEGYTEQTFADIDQFFNNFDVTNPPEYWSVEAVYLAPGTQLIMKPNTPHAVFTTEHSIAVGGHFFSFANIQQTFAGLVHVFVIDTFVTNTEHPKTTVLLLRMLQYLYKFYVGRSDPIKHAAEHLPILGEDMEIFVDILTLCNFCILANILDPRTYNFPDIAYGTPATPTHLAQRWQHDYNALTPDDRLHFSYTRGLAINLIHWLHCHYFFKDDDGTHNIISVARQFLHKQVRVILKYKELAEEEKIRGIPNCTASDVRHQIQLLFDGGMLEFGGLSLEDQGEDNLLLEIELRPEQRPRPLVFFERDSQQIGTAKGDKMFHTGSAKWFPLSNTSRQKGPVHNEEVANKDDESDSDSDIEARNTMQKEVGPNVDDSTEDDSNTDDEPPQKVPRKQKGNEDDSTDDDNSQG